LGAIAPDPVPVDEVWLDVGSRVGPRVLDHHGGDTTAWSATQLVLDRGEELLTGVTSSLGEIVFVTHNRPDLDAAASAWLAIRYFKLGGDGLSGSHIREIVEAVSANDQGIVRDSTPERSWPIVVRTVLETESERSDESLLLRVFGILDRTLGFLDDGQTIEDAAEVLSTSSVKVHLAHARRQYVEDMSRARLFQVRLPVNLIERELQTASNGPTEVPGKDVAKWSLADGVFLDDPSSALFKEMARSDIERSPSKLGFPLLVVSRPVDGPSRQEMWRHIISTDPLSGLTVEGLGALLEEAEKSVEAANGVPLRPGRRRLDAGAGRHGYDVAEPWYDGRGHNFTIVDCPGYEEHGRRTCASAVDPTTVLETVWHYGDPGKFVKVIEAEVTLMYPVQLFAGWSEEWPAGEQLHEKGSPLIDELSESGAFQIVHRRSPRTDVKFPGLLPLEERIVPFGADRGVLFLVFSADESASDLRELSRSLFALRWRLPGSWSRTGFEVLESEGGYHTVCCRMPSSEVAIEDTCGASAQALARVARAGGIGFADRLDDDELTQIRRRYTGDRQVVVVTGTDGLMVASERSHTLATHEVHLRPEQVSVLVGVAIAQRCGMQKIASEFSMHRRSRDPRSAERLILQDRARLLNREQELAFRQVAKDPLAQDIFDDVIEAIRVPQLIEQTRVKIESLAAQVRESRAQFYQRVGFWLSFLFAPLALTAGLFSGIQMDRDFAEKYLTPFPVGLEPSGWILFCAIFVALSTSLGVLWGGNRFAARMRDRRRD
jgi:hypothetical protein